VGEAHRVAANTKLNTESSRSHAILMVCLCFLSLFTYLYAFTTIVFLVNDIVK